MAFVLPAMSRFGLKSSVLANIMLGVIIGPSGFRVFQNTDWSQAFAQIGVLFFLCQQGLLIDLERLKKNSRDVFVIGFSQFALCTCIIFSFSCLVPGMSRLQGFIAAAALSLSSSAFVEQILDDHKERGTRHGRTAFGILLMQDLIVPLLLVLLPMLKDLEAASSPFPIIRQALIRTCLALMIAAMNGHLLLDWLFSFVAARGGAVALRSLSFCTIFGICFIFEAFGLPGTLGAFLSGVLLAGTGFKQQVNTVIAPVRDDFLGLFFITVGFGMDLQLVFSHPVLVASMISTLLLTKSVLTTLVCRASGLSWGNSQQIGLLLSQAGEFTYVIISTAFSLGMLTSLQYRLLATTVGASLFLTPLLADIGKDLAEHLLEMKDTSEEQLSSMPSTSNPVEVIIYGYGQIGKMISEVLDVRLVRWMAFDNNPELVLKARRKDLPIYYGDLQQLSPDFIPRGGLAGQAKMVIITVWDKESMEKAMQVKKEFPDLKVMASVSDLARAKMLEQHGVTPILPALPEDSMLLNLCIGAELLSKLGYTEEEIGPIVKEKRLELIRQEDTQQQVLSKAGLQQAGLPADLGTIARWLEEGNSNADEY